MPKGPVIDRDIREAIQDLALRGYTTAEIHRRIVDQFPTMPPSDRTVAKYARQVTPRDRSGEWRLADATGEEAALVLPVLAKVLDMTGGRTLHLSVAEADWIVKLTTAMPDIPPWTAYRVARNYLGHVELDKPTDFLDRWVAFAPWRDKSERWMKHLPNEEGFQRAVSKVADPARMAAAVWAEGGTIEPAPAREDRVVREVNAAQWQRLAKEQRPKVDRPEASDD